MREAHVFAWAAALAVAIAGSCQQAAAQPASRPAPAALIHGDQAVPGEAGLRVLPMDERVLYEPGSQELAGLVARELDQGLRRAQAFHHLRLHREAEIRVFATQESFTRATLSKDARGMAILGFVVCLSPKLAAERERIPGILTHELSHILLQQHVGPLRNRRLVPFWFQEGLATLASQGAGAERVSSSEARAAILRGETFAPASTGNLLERRPPPMPVQMFYRQSEMFVAYLRERDPALFVVFLESLREETFAGSFATHFGGSVSELWRGFIRSL